MPGNFLCVSYVISSFAHMIKKSKKYQKQPEDKKLNTFSARYKLRKMPEIWQKLRFGAFFWCFFVVFFRSSG